MVTPVAARSATLLPPAPEAKPGEFQTVVNGVVLAAMQRDDPGKDYRVATDNETWPPVEGTTVENASAYEGPGALRYKSQDGQDVVVKPHINPKLHEFLTRLQALNTSPETLDYIEMQKDFHKSELMHREGDLPALKDTKFVDVWKDGILVGTNDGKYITITRQLSPETFERAKSMHDTLKGIKNSQDQGYELVNDNPFTDAQVNGAVIGAENEVGPGLIRAEVDDGKGGKRKVIVSKDMNPALYERFAGVDNSRRYGNGPIDEARGNADLSPVSGMDISGMETTKTDPNDPNRKLTVGELTWQTLIEEWKTGIENGSIPKDDDRAKFYNLLRAQAMAANGADMVVLDMQSGQNIGKVTARDLESIFDKVKMDEQVAALFGSEKVQGDFLKHQKQALDSLPNKDQVFADLEKTAFSAEYIKYINDLKAKGQGALAEADIAKMYASLAAFDPAKAGDFAQKLLFNTMLVDLDGLLANTAGINEENTVLATQDVVKTILSALKKGGIDLPRRTVESIDRFVNEYLADKQSVKTFHSALQALGDTFIKNGVITQADIDGLFKKDIFQTLDLQTNGGFTSTLAVMNNKGVLGSAGGFISLASGIYQLAGKGGSLADTPEERLAIAKEMIAFFGASQHFATLGSNIYDKIMGTGVNKMLGLDKTLPQIFGNDKPGGTPVTPDIEDRFITNLDDLYDAAPIDKQQWLAEKMNNLSPDEVQKILDGIEKGYAKNPALPDSTKFTRGASAFLRVLDAGANVFGGAADIALGGLSIKKGVGNNDGVLIAQGAIQVAAGAFTLGGGIASGWALTGSTIARALAGPLFWAGAILTVALTPFLIVEDIKHNNRMDAHRQDMLDLFKALNDQGVLTPEGLKRYEFLDAYMYGYGQRDAPEDVSIFEYRADEVAFYMREGHLPEAGWDDVPHDDYDGDGSNIDTLLDRGSTVGS
jgi:hypothetical protein